MIETCSSCTSLLASGTNTHRSCDKTNTDMWERSNRGIPFSSCSLFFLSSLFISKECKYNVQQRHSTKQWRAAEQKRWSCWGGGGGGGRCTERRGLGLRISQRSSNQTSAPGASAKCLRLITVWLLLVRLPRAGVFWMEDGKFDLTGWSKDDLDNFAP